MDYALKNAPMGSEVKQSPRELEKLIIRLEEATSVTNDNKNSIRGIRKRIAEEKEIDQPSNKEPMVNPCAPGLLSSLCKLIDLLERNNYETRQFLNEIEAVI